MDWYYAKGGQQLGPIERAALEQMVASGQVRPDDLVWNEGMTNWQPASTMPELNGLIPTSIAPLPPTIAPPAQHPQQQQVPLPGFTAQPLEYGGGIAGQTPSYNGLAIGGFVTALFGLPCIPCISYVAGPTGLILSWIALNGMSKCGNPTGKPLAIAGVVIGGVFSLITIGMLIFIFAIRH